MAPWCLRSCAVSLLALLALASVPGAAQAASGAASTAPIAALTTAPTAGPAAVPAHSHLLAAQRQSRGQPALVAMVRRHCARSAAPKTAALALQALTGAEAAHRAVRALPRPQPQQQLQAVVLRSCAAHHATRLQPGASFPVWWHTRLDIDSVRPTATGFEVQARASTAQGAVASSRVTLARGLHHACFIATDASGQAACVMVDTHPHGGRPDAWAEAHEGPVIATFAGSVSPERVELPAVAVRDMPVFASLPAWR